MKKILTFLVCGFMAGDVFAAGENVATSKAFVDTAVAQKQDAIPANDGVAQVLTNTGTAGTVGTKNIYDSTGEYAEQTDALVTAGDFNSGVQDAIDAEFTCIKYNPNDPTDCWLVSINSVVEQNMPAGYTALSHISTKDAIVDYGWYPTLQTYKVKAKFRFNSLSTTKYNSIFGADNGMFFGVSADGYWAPHIITVPNYPAGGNISKLIPITTGVWYTMEDVLDRTKTRDNMYGTINGIEYTGTRTLSSSAYVWFIGDFSTQYANHSIFDGDIAYITVYENDVMIHNYVPARHDNAIGMYDTVANRFFTMGNAPVYMPND